MWCKRAGYVTVKYLQGAIYIFTYHNETLTNQNSCYDFTKLPNLPQEQTVGWKQEDCCDSSQSLYVATLKGQCFKGSQQERISQTQPVFKHLEASVIQYYSVINSTKRLIYTSTRSILPCLGVRQSQISTLTQTVFGSYSTHKPDRLVLLFSIIGKHIN